MLRRVASFLILLVVAIGVDVAWFALFANPYYIRALGPILRQTETGFAPDFLSGLAVYVLLILGIMWFVLPHASKKPKKAALWGAAYALIVYGIYDMTNYATIAAWSLNICLLDIGWGIVYCAFLSTFALYLQKKFH